MIALLALLALPARAADQLVTKPGNAGAGTLRAALNAASSGDTITFDPNLTVTLTSALGPVPVGVVVDGGGTAALTCAPALTSATGLVLSTDAVVRDLRVTGCNHGLEVLGARARVEGNVVSGQRAFGILVTGSVPPDAVVPGPDGDVVVRRYGLPHRDVPAPLSAADRRMDLDCDGYAGAGVVTHGLARSHEVVGGVQQPLPVGTTQQLLDLRFQANPGAMDHDGKFQLAASPGREATKAEALRDATHKAPVFPDAVLYPGCGARAIPVGGAGLRAPLVVYGHEGWSPLTLIVASLNGAEPSHVADLDHDGDGLTDRWYEFDVDEVELHLRGAPASQRATEAFFYGVDVAGREVVATLPFTIARQTLWADGDGDGIHDTCDRCPSVGSLPPGRGPDGCPP